MKKKLNSIANGTEYVYWKVIEKMFHKTDDGYQQYVCQCRCGVKDIIRGTDLHRGRSIGCRLCLGTIPLIGLKIGSWLLLRERPERSNDAGKHIMLDCECECGFAKIIKATKFRSGRFPHCPSCKITDTEKICAGTVKKAKQDSAEFIGRKDRAKLIFESDINPHLKIKLLERFLELLQKRISFFMIELNGDSEEFKDFCKQLETTYHFISELKKLFTIAKIDPALRPTPDERKKETDKPSKKEPVNGK